MAENLTNEAYDPADMKIIDRYVEAIDRAEDYLIRPGNIDNPSTPGVMAKKVALENHKFLASRAQAVFKDKVKDAKSAPKKDRPGMMKEAKKLLKDYTKRLNDDKNKRVQAANRLIKEEHAATAELRGALKDLDNIKDGRVKDLAAKLKEVHHLRIGKGKHLTMAQLKQDVMSKNAPASKVMPER